MSEIKDPLQRCRERNRLLRRALFEWQEQAARIGNLIGCSSVDIVEHITKMHSDLSTANATISALEGKLAAAEALLRRSRAAFVVLSDTLEPRKGGNLAREQIAAIDEWQKENTDES